MGFQTGQRVVCINARDTSERGRNRSGPRKIELVERQIYVVRWYGIWGLQVCDCGLRAQIDAPCVRLVGVRGGPDEWMPNCKALFDQPFYAARFRPLVERKVERRTDISVFLRMLTKRQREDV